MHISSLVDTRAARVALAVALMALALFASVALSYAATPQTTAAGGDVVLPVEPDGGIGGDVVLPVEPDGGIGGDVVLPVEPDGGIGN